MSRRQQLIAWAFTIVIVIGLSILIVISSLNSTYLEPEHKQSVNSHHELMRTDIPGTSMAEKTPLSSGPTSSFQTDPTQTVSSLSNQVSSTTQADATQTASSSSKQTTSTTRTDATQTATSTSKQTASKSRAVTTRTVSSQPIQTTAISISTTQATLSESVQPTTTTMLTTLPQTTSHDSVSSSVSSSSVSPAISTTLPTPATTPVSTLSEITTENNIDRSPEVVAREFLIRNFSVHGQMAPAQIFARDTSTLQKLLAKRKELVLQRRETFNLGLHNPSFHLELLEQRIESQTAYLSILSTEQCSFSNPQATAKGRYYYLLMLVKEQNEWKIKSILSRDRFFGVFEKVSSARVFEVRQAIRTGKGLAKKFQLTTNESVIDRRYQLEKNNIVKEKQEAGLSEKLPVSSGENRALFDRDAMKHYQATWALSRNPKYSDYTRVGGDCQNYISQVIAAGGTPMDDVGSQQWYYFRSSKRSPSWAGVGYFLKYITRNADKGPRGVIVQSAQSLQCGDVVHLDWDYDGYYNHAISIYRAGSSPTFSGHTNDELDYPLYYMPGHKQYYHLVDYGQ